MAKQLSNLSERELLILLNEKVERLEKEVAGLQSFATELKQLEMRVLEYEVKWRTWAAVLGFAAGVGGSLLPKLFNL